MAVEGTGVDAGDPVDALWADVVAWRLDNRGHRSQGDGVQPRTGPVVSCIVV